MLKKVLSLIISLVFVFALVGCSNTKNSNTDTSDNTSVQGSSIKKEEKSSAKNEESMDLELINDDNLTMTITKKFEKGDSSYKEIGYKVTIVNKTDDTDLLIGLNNSSVDGVMNDPAWATSIPAGKKANETITWWVGDGSDEYNSNVESLDDLKNIEGTITVSNDDTYETLGEYDISIK